MSDIHINKEITSFIFRPILSRLAFEQHPLITFSFQGSCPTYAYLLNYLMTSGPAGWRHSTNKLPPTNTPSIILGHYLVPYINPVPG